MHRKNIYRVEKIVTLDVGADGLPKLNTFTTDVFLLCKPRIILTGVIYSIVNETTKLLDFSVAFSKPVNPNKLERALMSVLFESGRTISRKSCASAQFPG